MDKVYSLMISTYIKTFSVKLQMS